MPMETADCHLERRGRAPGAGLGAGIVESDARVPEVWFSFLDPRGPLRSLKLQRRQAPLTKRSSSVSFLLWARLSCCIIVIFCHLKALLIKIQNKNLIKRDFSLVDIIFES